MTARTTAIAATAALALLATHVTMASAAPPGRLLRTGQTRCWDGNDEWIPCAGTGQDGDLRKGLTRRYVDNGDGTITDERTGLMWEKLDLSPTIHDIRTTYSWAAAFEKVATLNATAFAGHADWRLPNIFELNGIVNHGRKVPLFSDCICDIVGCTCSGPLFYWSSTTRVSSPTYAWLISSIEGPLVYALSKASAFPGVRAVRGGAHRGLPSRTLRTGQAKCWDASGTQIACAGTGQDGDLRRGLKRRYTDNADGTITDEKTGLVWEKLDDSGTIHDKDTTYTWAAAFEKVAALNAAAFAGYSNWRLPNSFELFSIVNLQKAAPAVSPIFDDACTAACTSAVCSCTPSSSPPETLFSPAASWTSTSSGHYAYFALLVDFRDGSVHHDWKVVEHAVRAVRGGGSCD